MFKHAIIYRLASMSAIAPDELDERLQRLAFVECTPTQQASAGWTPPRGEDHGVLAESVGQEILLEFTQERRAVPAAAVKRELEKRLDKIEAETGRRPKGKRAKEVKEEVVHELLPRAFAKRSSMPVWISLARALVVIGAGSIAAADKAVTALVEVLGAGTVVHLVSTETSPAAAMAHWLREQEGPAGFTVDRECELKQPDSEKAVVRYTRHTLDIDEVGEHIQQGKLPTKVALTWKGRVSYVLTDAGTLRRIKLLDVVLEGRSPGADGFDADAAITTGELGSLVPALIDALGGEVPHAQPASAQLAPSTSKGDDPLLSQARALVLENKRASISLVQRRLRIGYNRAACLLETLEEMHVVSVMDSRGNRAVLAAA